MRMKSVRNVLSLAVVGASLSAVGMAQATVVGLTNGDFQDSAPASGGVSQAVPNWYESSTASNYNDWIWTPSSQMTTTSTVYGMSQTTGYIYQQIGTYTSGETVTISGDAYNRSGDTFRSVVVGLYVGNFTGADGTALSATLLDSTTLTTASLGFSGTSAQHATFSFDLDEGLSGVAGQTLWIRIATTATSGESFLDNLAVVGHPPVSAPTPAALPAGLSLLGLAAFSTRRRA